MHAFLIAARTLHFAATVSLAGVVAFWSLIALPAFSGERAGPDAAAQLWPRLARLAWMSLGLGLLSGAGWLVIEAPLMSGESFGAALSHGVVGIVLTRTRFGEDWLLRLALAAVLAGCLLVPPGRRRRAWAGITLAGVAGLLGSLAWSGHGAATPGRIGMLHLAADIVHLLAAGAWVGGLVPLAVLLAQAQRAGGAVATEVARAAARRFSALGLASVAALFASGIVNSWVLVGGLPPLIGSAYGRLLVIKVALFAAMVAIAGVNRQCLAPRLADAAAGRGRADAAIRHLRRNALGEAALGLLVVAIVGVLGTLPPGGHHMAGLAPPIPAEDGWGGIRTHEELAFLPVFKTGALNRSATHPQLCFRASNSCTDPAVPGDLPLSRMTRPF
jgi:copper resistance protein D